MIVLTKKYLNNSITVTTVKDQARTLNIMPQNDIFHQYEREIVSQSNSILRGIMQRRIMQTLQSENAQQTPLLQINAPEASNEDNSVTEDGSSDEDIFDE